MGNDDFSLRDRVKEALATSLAHDPREVAAELATALPDEVLREALAQALPNYVRITMTNGQRPTLRQWDELCEVMAPAGGGQPQPPPVQMTVYAAGQWKPLKDCSVDDLDEMAARRVQLAEGNAAWAARFKALADGTGVQPTQAAPQDPPLRDGLAAVPVLLAKRDRLLEHIADGTSPTLDELSRRREALLALRAVREMEAEEFARVEDALAKREVQHGTR